MSDKLQFVARQTEVCRTSPAY